MPDYKNFAIYSQGYEAYHEGGAMELGNLLFGHSRGQFPIDREAGYEEQLWRLFDALGCSLYGENFDNDVFSVFPYYWGDCTCGLDDAEVDWEEANPHSPDCYQTEYQRLRDPLWSLGESIRVRLLCEQHGLSFPEDSAIHCTCGRKKRFDEWLDTHFHSDNCPIIRPNFHFKISGFTISWYKFPLRDSYMSEQLTVKEFSAMVDECISSLDKKGE